MRIKRLLKLLQIVRSGRARTTLDLTQFLGVSRRTVFRDLRLLQTAGVPCVFRPVARRYATAAPDQLPPICMTQAEVDALMLAVRHAVAHQRLPDGTSAMRAATAIENALPQRLRDHARRSLDGIEMRSGPASDSAPVAPVFTSLLLAAARRRKVYACYEPNGEERVIRFVLHPYRLVYGNHGWHVVGFSEQTSRIKSFRLERFVRWRTMVLTFQPPAKFDVNDYFGNAWCLDRGKKRHHVRIRFSRAVGDRVRRVTWHSTQHTAWENDGSLLFEADVDGLGEILRWVLGYGDQARVLEPPALRRLVAGHAERLRSCYDGRSDDVHDGQSLSPTLVRLAPWDGQRGVIRYPPPGHRREPYRSPEAAVS